MEFPNQKPFINKVLIIDDSEIDRHIASFLIKKYKISEEIVSLDSADSAFKYFESLKESKSDTTHLIFLDIRMPLKDGFQFLEEFSKLQSSIKANCKIIMLSTSIDTKDHERAADSEFVDLFLNKPLDNDKMKSLEEKYFIHR